MKIFAFQLGQLGTNSYLVFPDDSSEAILVDAPLDAAEEIPNFLKQHERTLSAILLTHGHWDHMWDAAKLAKITGAKIYASKGGRQLIEEPNFQSRFLMAGDMPVAKIDVFVEDGQRLEIGGLSIKCLDADGHCPGSVLYYVADKDCGKLFAGDVIFDGSIGRTDLLGGDFARLKDSIEKKIYTLPDNTVILPGHGDATSVGDERKSNPFVRG